MSVEFYWNPEGTKFAEQFPGKLSKLSMGLAVGGYQFHFKGYDFAITAKTIRITEDLEVTIPLVANLKIRSFKDWITFIKEQGGVIEAEYGVEYSIEDFIKYIEEDGPTAPPEKRGKNGFDLVRNDKSQKDEFWYKNYFNPELHWKDDEGYFFSLSTSR